MEYKAVYDDDYISHYGVLGMRWGHRKRREPKDHKKLAKRYNRLAVGSAGIGFAGIMGAGVASASFPVAASILTASTLIAACGITIGTKKGKEHHNKAEDERVSNIMKKHPHAGDTKWYSKNGSKEQKAYAKKVMEWENLDNKIISKMDKNTNDPDLPKLDAKQEKLGREILNYNLPTEEKDLINGKTIRKNYRR